MDVTELRVGNYLQYLSGDVFQVKETDFERIRTINEKLHPRPISLTPEWLEKAGFVKVQESPFENIKLSYWVNEGIVLFYNQSDKRHIFLIGTGFTYDGKYYASTLHWIQTLHDLQNFFYTNRNKELTIKTNG